MRSPRFSKRSLMAPVRLRRVASGLMIDKVRSVAIRVSPSAKGRGVISSETASGNRCRRSAGLRPLLPTGRRLLPIGQAVSGLASAPPAYARRLDGRRVVAVEQIGGTGKSKKIRRLDPVHQHYHRRAVRVLVEMGQPDRLQLRVAVAGRT